MRARGLGGSDRQPSGNQPQWPAEVEGRAERPLTAADWESPSSSCLTPVGGGLV